MNIFTKIKQTHNFTESEQVFVDYIMNYPQEIINSNIKQLSQNSYVSMSTIYRVIEKLDLSGFNQLKLEISLNLDKFKEEDNVDYNYPFNEKDTQYQIMNKMSWLYCHAVQSTLKLIDLEELLKVVNILYKANNITIYPSIGNYFMAESFQQSMLEIGVKVNVLKERYYQHWDSKLCKKGDVIIIISYAGKTPHILDILKELHRKEVTVILISSIKELDISKYTNYHLYLSSNENSKEKQASFASRVSLQYILDCIYACYFNKDYQKHLNYKLTNYID